ncbi:MAG: hypothetical protein WCJ37_09060 [Syntrophus sp. (in: bacteria)]
MKRYDQNGVTLYLENGLVELGEGMKTKVIFLPQAEEEMNDAALFFYESLPELRQGLSVGFVKRIDETICRFYLMN